MKLTNDFIEYLGKALMDPEWPREIRRDPYPEDHRMAREAAVLMIMTGVSYVCDWGRHGGRSIIPGPVNWVVYIKYDGYIYETKQRETKTTD